MATNKTQVTEVAPATFVAQMEDAKKQADAAVLLQLMGEMSGCEPRMWGPTIIGYGKYHYKYASGHEGDAPLVGFSPRKAKHSLYVLTRSQGEDEILARLGKYKTGKSCLYVNKLADIDLNVLRELIAHCLKTMRENHEIIED